MEKTDDLPTTIGERAGHMDMESRFLLPLGGVCMSINRSAPSNGNDGSQEGTSSACLIRQRGLLFACNGVEWLATTGVSFGIFDASIRISEMAP